MGHLDNTVTLQQAPAELNNMDHTGEYSSTVAGTGQTCYTMGRTFVAADLIPVMTKENYRQMG